jgi:nitric oxide reductase large subunit
MPTLTMLCWLLLAAGIVVGVGLAVILWAACAISGRQAEQGDE